MTHASEAPQPTQGAGPEPTRQPSPEPTPQPSPQAAPRPPAPPGWAPAPHPEGRQAAENALLFGILGIVLGLGVVFGPLALWQAGRANRLGVEATAGRVLGWVGLALGAVAVLAAVIGLIALLVMMASMPAFLLELEQTVTPAALLAAR